jgi:hypothetical protein
MADYDCWPLWQPIDDGPTNVDPADLPITPALRDALYDWARRYNDILNREDPAQSNFKTLEAEAAFKADGQALLERLTAELGDGYSLILKV